MDGALVALAYWLAFTLRFDQAIVLVVEMGSSDPLSFKSQGPAE